MPAKAAAAAAPPPPCQWRPPANEVEGATVVSASTAAVASTALRPINREARLNIIWDLQWVPADRPLSRTLRPMLGSQNPTQAERGCVIVPQPPLIDRSCSASQDDR